MNAQFWWFLTRSSGIVAWVMLTLSVIWGIILSTKAFPEQRRPIWLLSVHRWLGGLTMSFLAVHLVALVADSYVQFGLADLTIPYATDWKPGAIALGVLGMWLLVAVELTSLAMRKLPRKVWRVVHLSSYIAFWFTAMHAAFVGSDATKPMYQWTAVASIAAVAWALIYRILTRRSARRAALASRGDRRVATVV